MKNRQIVLMDLGLDESFEAGMTFAQGVLANVNAGYDEPILDIDLVRSRDPQTISAALTAPCSVLHVMAHGDHGEGPSFSSTDGKVAVSLDVLAQQVRADGRGISASTVIADGCKTGIGVWQRSLRDCLRQPLTFVGTSKLIGWHESTVFCSAFYGALTRNKGAGTSSSEQGLDAATRAITAFETLVGRPCPFKVVTLTPSRKAQREL